MKSRLQQLLATFALLAAGCGDNDIDAAQGTKETLVGTSAHRSTSEHFQMVTTMRAGDAAMSSTKHHIAGVGIGGAQ